MKSQALVVIGHNMKKRFAYYYFSAIFWHCIHVLPVIIDSCLKTELVPSMLLTKKCPWLMWL